MNKLPKDKKNKLVLVILVTLIVTAGWAFGVLAWQRDNHRKTQVNLQKTIAQFQSMTNMMAHAQSIEVELADAGGKLERLEATMASGDIYSWVVNTLREFRQNYKVEMPQVAQPAVAENKLLPNFPYRQASISVVGRASYHDLGMFVSDFENRFPFARINNLEVKSAGVAGSGNSAENERLDFSMDMIFLVKPNTL